MNATALEFLTPAHQSALQSFKLPLDQEKFTSLPQNLTAPLPESVYPIVIVSPKPVGFFLLHENERVVSYTNTPDALLLTAFSINHVAQGKGYAKAALQMLPAFVNEHFPHIQEVVLSVNFKNEAAFSLYKKVGFVDTNRRIEGDIGVQRIMSLSL